MAVVNGYCSLAEFKSFARITSTDATDDGVIEDMIEAASRYIDDLTGRQFYASTETRLFSIPRGDNYRELWFDKDLLTISTLTNGDAVVIASTQYNLLPRNETPKFALRLKESSSVAWEDDSSGNTEFVISVAGTWGYSSSAPDDIKELALEIARNLYKSRFGENAEAVSTITAAGVVVTPKAMPSWGKDVIARYRRAL
jgi:hypothetical protein